MRGFKLIFIGETRKKVEMTVYHDEVEIEDFEYDEDEDLYTYPCVS